MAFTTPVTGTVTGELIDSGVQVVQSGGIVIDCVVNGATNVWDNYPIQQVENGGTASGSIIRTGKLYLNGGAQAYDVVQSGGLVWLLNGSNTISGLTVSGDGWTQDLGGNQVSNVTMTNYAVVEVMGGSVWQNVVIDAGTSRPLNVASGGAVLYLTNATCDTITIKNGGRADIYDSGIATNVTVEAGGTLFMSDDSLGTEPDWAGNWPALNGTVENAVVKSGGAIWISSAATLKNVTIEYGGTYYLGEVSATQYIDIKVYNADGTYFTIFNDPSGLQQLIVRKGERYNAGGKDFIFTVNDLQIYEGGMIYNMSYASNVGSGTFIFDDGTKKAFTIRYGQVRNYVVGSGCEVLGNYGVTNPNINRKPALIDVLVLEGGILNGFQTSNYSSYGTYRYADGTTANWSFGNGAASGMIINSGTFVVNGVSSAGADDGGSATDITVNHGTLIIGNGATVTGLVTTGASALRIYGGATISGIDKDTGKTISVSGGIGDDLVINRGGFYSVGDGQTLRDTVFKDGSTIMLSGAFTLENCTFEGTVSIAWNNFNTGFKLVNTVLPGNIYFEEDTNTLYNYTQDGGSFSVPSGETLKFNNLTVKNLTLNIANGAYVDGLTIVSCTGLGYFGYNATLKNVKTNTGCDGFYGNVDGLYMDQAEWVHWWQNGGLAENVNIHNGGSFIVNNGAAAKNVTVNADARWYYTYVTVYGQATIENLSILCGGGLYFGETENGMNLSLKGDCYFSNLYYITNGNPWGFGDQGIALAIDNTTSFVLGGKTNIYCDIIQKDQTVDKTVTFTGVGNDIYSGHVIRVANVNFDTRTMWYQEDYDSSYIIELTYVHAQKNLTVTLREGQFMCGFGNLNDADVAQDVHIVLGNQTFTMHFGETREINGWTVKLYTEGDSMAGRLSIRATTANTELGWNDLGWSDCKQYAPYYVNDLAAGSGLTIAFGDKFENEGGNAMNDIFGTITTGGVVTDSQNSSTIYGGSTTRGIATSWVRVSGGTKNVIYGAGLGQTNSDGVNVYLGGTAATTTKLVVAAGKDAVINVDNINVYAVNMDVAAGKHRYVTAGGENCTINGDIICSLYGGLVYSIFSGAGASDVNGDIYISLNLTEYDGYQQTGNFYGGATAAINDSATVGRDTAIVGDVVMDVSGGDYQGIIFGGSRAWGTVASIDGGTMLKLDKLTMVDNPKMLKFGSTAWAIAGSQIQNNGTAAGIGMITGKVVAEVGAANLVNLVGAGQATGAGSTLTVGGVEMNIDGATITDSVFGAGYASEDAAITVAGNVEININGTAGSSTSIGYAIYAAGRTVGGSGSVTVNGDSIVRFSGIAESISVGTVDALGKGNCVVNGSTVVEFNDLTGAFAGNLRNFDTVVFSGNTALTAASDYASSNWMFDAWDRTAAGMFAPSAFDLEGDERTISLSFSTSADASFDLIDVSDEDLEGVNIRFLDADGAVLASGVFGDSLSFADGVVDLSIDRGVLVAAFTKKTQA
ncbi:MAG: beta strand repeat-containing protein [Victivallaceae bacterium]|nr:hypothetical protein [Victivallaceae bacterium]